MNFNLNKEACSDAYHSVIQATHKLSRKISMRFCKFPGEKITPVDSRSVRDTLTYAILQMCALKQDWTNADAAAAAT